MGADISYAYNYWRKVFVQEARGRFSKQDFDAWFRGGAKPVSDAVGHLETGALPGSKEDFYVRMRAALMAMLEASARGDFGK